LSERATKLSESEAARNAAWKFVLACASPSSQIGYRLTPSAEPTAFGLCFGIFLLRLLGDQPALEASRAPARKSLLHGLEEYRVLRSASGTRDLALDKPYLQLLTFTLSALSILGELDAAELEPFVAPAIRIDTELQLKSAGALEGRATSGNLAMMHAILLVFARDHLGLDMSARLDRWFELHDRAMNRFGFWGENASPTYLQFQNGYHQYEIYHWLKRPSARHAEAARAVAALADSSGQFAPYPGGGGCYDYDAVFMLTTAPESLREELATLLARTRATLLARQNADGGFAESALVRPRSAAWLAFLTTPSRPGLAERLRYGVTLQRPKHSRIKTHWTRYDRGWNESDLWDTWFRLLAIARIEGWQANARPSDWGFIDFPGIGAY
jgi:hypothetical protein